MMEIIAELDYLVTSLLPIAGSPKYYRFTAQRDLAVEEVVMDFEKAL